MPLSRVTEATGEAFNALVQLRHLVSPLPVSAEAISREVIAIIERTQQRARRAGYTHQEIEDMSYALVAAVDEVALARPGELAEHWVGNLLQMHFFGENVAGDVFFSRLERLMRAESHVHSWRDVLRVYFLCLSFGFAGRYRVRGGEGELLEISDAARALVVQDDDDIKLSPRGARPDDRGVKTRRRLPMIGFAAAVLGLSALVYVGLRVSLASSLDDAVRCLDAVGRRGVEVSGAGMRQCVGEEG
ncbi:MAG: DotU family type IV/VI secretion system protein [Myxococcales bacterium]|nr:DotU family type IV/VI secretion system protein [Myxococcales bacterium]